MADPSMIWDNLDRYVVAVEQIAGQVQRSGEVDVAGVMRRYSFIACFAVLDHRMYDLAVYLQRKSKNRILVDDLKGSGFMRSIRYIERLTDLKRESIQGWEEIRRFCELRNLFVHRLGRLDPDIRKHEELRRYIASEPQFLDLRYGTTLIVKPGFAEHAARAMRAFADSVHGLLGRA